MGRTEGGMVFSQTGIVAYNGQTLLCRRIVVKLDQPTRDGETFISLLTNLPESQASALVVAQLYRSRWRIETLFQVATLNFHCEIKTLGYPRAALFSFCMALVAYNLFSCLKTLIGRVHEETDNIPRNLSYYYLAEEVEGTYRGMMIALPPQDWQDFGSMSLWRLSKKTGFYNILTQISPLLQFSLFFLTLVGTITSREQQVIENTFLFLRIIVWSYTTLTGLA